MTNHLTEEERIDALDGALAIERRPHIDGCADCQQAVASLRQLTEDLAEDPVPEPPALFWDDFHARVNTAVYAAGGRRWWRSASPVWVALATAALVVLTLWLPSRGPEPSALLTDADPEVISAEESVQWEFMSELDHEAARVVLAPSAGAVDAAYESLTDSERAALVLLLQADLKEGNN